MFSSMTTSPWRISEEVGSSASRAAVCAPTAMRIRASTSAGPAVSRMTSLAPQSAVNAERPPSVVIAMMGAPTPVVESKRVSDFALGRSRRASTKTISITGVSTRTDASNGATLQVCCKRPSAGRTSALAPCELVSSNTFAIV